MSKHGDDSSWTSYEKSETLRSKRCRVLGTLIAKNLRPCQLLMLSSCDSLTCMMNALKTLNGSRSTDKALPLEQSNHHRQCIGVRGATQQSEALGKRFSASKMHPLADEGGSPEVRQHTETKLVLVASLLKIERSVQCVGK